MDIPFLSSGAVSRSHYNLVYRVENTKTSSEADNVIGDFLKKTGARRKSRLSFDSVMSLLISVMYCNQMSTIPLPQELLEGVYRFAVDMMVGGKTYEQRRTVPLLHRDPTPKTSTTANVGEHGHQGKFDSWFTSWFHMMNHTQDLQSPGTRYNLLALSLLSTRSRDFLEPFPAFQSQLEKLITGRSSPNIRHKALLTVACFPRNVTGAVWEGIKNLYMSKLLVRGETGSTDNSLELILESLFKNELVSAEEFVRLAKTVLVRQKAGLKMIVGIIRVFCEMSDKLSKEQQTELIQGLEPNLKTCCESKTPSPLLLEFSRLSSKIQPFSLEKLSRVIKPLKKFLTSRDPNVQYMALKCLNYIPTSLWAGRGESDVGETRFSDETFKEEEVKLMMRNLDSPDLILRKMTLSVLNCVDRQIPKLYFNQLLSYTRHCSSYSPINEDSSVDEVQKQWIATRALEVSIILVNDEGDDSNAFGRRLMKILKFLGEDVRLTAKEAGTRPIQQELAEVVLFFVQKASVAFQMSFVDLIVGFLAECDVWTYRTMLVIACAILGEFLPRSPQGEALFVDKVEGEEQRVMDIISVLSNLFVQATSLQELLLLTILRLFAEVEVKANEPGDMNLEKVRHSVKEVRSLSTTRKYIRSRCDDFLEWSAEEKRVNLSKVAKEAKSRSLPAFATSLRQNNDQQPRKNNSSAMQSSQSPVSPPTSSQLLYKPYEVPPLPKQTLRPRGFSSLSSSSSGPSREHKDNNSPRIISPGDLSLLNLDSDLRENRNLRPSTPKGTASPFSPPGKEVDMDPFLTSPTPPTASVLFDLEDVGEVVNFEETWSKLEGLPHARRLRGWAMGDKGRLLEVLKSIEYEVDRKEDVLHSEGFERVIISRGNVPTILLELKDVEGGCLWKMAGLDSADLGTIKSALDHFS